jgi:hypothetical protein
MKWCQEYLQQLGFNPSQPASDSIAPHRTIYLQLRTAINEHLISNMTPELSLSRRPTGAFDWQPSPTENVREVGFAGDDAGEDMEDNVENDVKDGI